MLAQQCSGAGSEDGGVSPTSHTCGPELGRQGKAGSHLQCCLHHLRPARMPLSHSAEKQPAHTKAKAKIQVPIAPGGLASALAQGPLAAGTAIAIPWGIAAAAEGPQRPALLSSPQPWATHHTPTVCKGLGEWGKATRTRVQVLEPQLGLQGGTQLCYTCRGAEDERISSWAFSTATLAQSVSSSFSDTPCSKNKVGDS